MKKAVVIAFIAAILSTSSTIAAFATAKAGAACSKAGLTSIVSGKKYTCIKLSKKLVWDKGVSVVIPAPGKTSNPTTSPSPAPSQTSSPTPTISPTSTPLPVIVDTKFYGWNFRFNTSGVLERRKNGTNIWTMDATRPGQIVSSIRSKAFEEIKNYQKSTANKSLTINFHFSPNVQKNVIETYKKYFDQALNFFSYRIPNGSILEVVIATEKDDSYRKEELKNIFPNQSEANDFYNRGTGMYHQFDIENPLSASGGGTVAGTNTTGKYLYSGAVCSCFSGENLLMYNVPHEVTHFYQFASTPTIPKQNFSGNFPNFVEGKIFIPSSIIEGSANTLGSSLTVDFVGWYSDLMDWHLGRYKSSGILNSIKTLDEAINLMKISESWLPEKTGYGDLNYVIGQLQSEYFIASYGMVAYFDLFDNIQKFGDFDTGLQKTIGKSKAEFYSESAPYVMQAFNAVTL